MIINRKRKRKFVGSEDSNQNPTTTMEATTPQQHDEGHVLQQQQEIEEVVAV
jgi:hypothetical protein